MIGIQPRQKKMIRKRPCKECNKMFLAPTKFSFLCESCKHKHWVESYMKRHGEKYKFGSPWKRPKGWRIKKHTQLKRR